MSVICHTLTTDVKPYNVQSLFFMIIYENKYNIKFIFKKML